MSTTQYARKKVTDSIREKVDLKKVVLHDVDLVDAKYA